MPRNGSGVYTLPTGNPVVTGTTISSTVHNNTMSDVADALTASATADGQKVYSGAQDYNGNKLILDLDGDTSITADTDDRIDFEAGGEDRLSLSADEAAFKVDVSLAEGKKLDLSAGALLQNSLTDGITAGTTQTQGGATALTTALNIVGTVATGGDGVRLPAAEAGLEITIFNQSANYCWVWPASGDSISDAETDARDPIALGGGESVTYIAKDDESWVREASASSGSRSGRNLVINGSFSVWQLGTTYTDPGTDTVTADQWINLVSNDAEVDILRSTDVPTFAEAGVVAPYSWHFDVTTADTTIGASQYHLVEHRVEGQRIRDLGFGQAGTRYITLSFWVKSSKTGAFSVAFRNDGSNHSYIEEYTVDAADTWEKKTITLPVDSSGTWLYDTGIGLRLDFVLAAGSTFQSTAGSWQAANVFATSNQVNALDSTSNSFRLALVQLEAGQAATAFEAVPPAEELARCQRYLRRIGTGVVGAVYDAANINVGITYDTMRATPSVSLAAGALQIVIGSTAPSAATPSIQSLTSSPSGARMRIAGFSGLSTGAPLVVETADAIILNAGL